MKRARFLVGLMFTISAISLSMSMAVFFYVSFAYGGSADIGKIDAGRYFLGNHGRFYEVSRNIFALSQWTTNILEISLLVAGTSGVAFWAMGGFRRAT